MTGLPKSYIKKYGVTKKAWRMYKASKGKRKVTPKRKVRTMARRRRRSPVRRTVKRAYRKYSRGLNFKNEAKGVAIATFLEPTVDSLIDKVAGNFNVGIGGIQTDDLIKVGLGWYFGKKKGVLGTTAKYTGLFGVRNIVKQVTAGGLGNIFGGNGTQQNGVTIIG